MINGDHNVIPPVGGKTGGPEQGPAKARRETRPDDAVEISGRAKAAEQSHPGKPGASNTTGEMGATLSRVRTQLHERIKTGFYDSEEVLESIANKMLDLFGL
jgi:hypothetical protein